MAATGGASGASAPVGHVDIAAGTAGETSKATSDIDAWIDQLKKCKPLSESQVRALCDRVSGAVPAD